MGVEQSSSSGGRKRSVTSRSRLLLDQRTPAEREWSEDARKSRRNRICAIGIGAILLLLIVGGIVFYLYFYDDLMESSSSSPSPWSLQNNIKLPQGFKIEEFVKGTPDNQIIAPRSLHVSAVGSSTIVYVGSDTRFVYALIDELSDGSNDNTFLIWESTDSFSVNSIAVIEQGGGTLFIDDMNGNIWVCRGVHAQVLNMQSQDDRLTDCSIWLSNIPLPGNQFRNNKHYLAINPSDNNLCIAFGIPSNINETREGSVEGTIRCFTSEEPQSINDTIVYAEGIRNSVGFEFNTLNDNELWFTDCGPDFVITEFGPPDDELNKVSNPGQQHFGFPYCHSRGFGDPFRRNAGDSANVADDVYGDIINYTCKETVYFPASQPLGPNVASLGMKFVTIPQIAPTSFVLIAQHGSRPDGSTTTTQLIGYRVMMVGFLNGFQQIDSHEIFAEGWLDEENQEIYGRPVDVEWLKNDIVENDNGFIVSDDYANVIYRIYYDPDDVEE